MNTCQGRAPFGVLSPEAESYVRFSEPKTIVEVEVRDGTDVKYYDSPYLGAITCGGALHDLALAVVRHNGYDPCRVQWGYRALYRETGGYASGYAKPLAEPKKASTKKKAPSKKKPTKEKTNV